MKQRLFFSIALLLGGYASTIMGTNLVKNDTIVASSGKGEERNVMLNASDANKPREIQIGLPSEDVNVYENGLPAVYSSSVHKLAAHWRSDASLGEVGLMSPSESAIMTGNIAYSVNSFSKLGQKEFKGVLNYHTNHFGWHNFDLNVSGGVGDRWLYTASIYQNFDPGSFDPKFENFSDRTQLYRAGLTRLFDDNRGKLSVFYKFSKSSSLGSMVNAAPFIYVGDGSVKEIPGFKLGTSSYAPEGGRFQYMDIMDGQMKTGRFGDFIDNRAHEVALLFDYAFDNGWDWSVNAKYMDAPEANYVDFGGSTISEVAEGDGLLTSDGTAYAGLVDQIPYERYEGFHIGDTHTYSDNTTVTIEPQRVVKNKLNYAATLQMTYNLTRNMGLTADATVATRYPRINEYAGTGPTEEQYNRVTIPLLRGGVFYHNDWIDLTSMVTYISKSNNIDQQNVTNPGTTDSKTVLLIYNINTMILDFFDFHSHLYGESDISTQSAIIMNRFLAMLENGEFRENRDVTYYADKLCVTSKYLSEVSKKISGYAANYWINRYTTLDISRLLRDKSLTFVQISDMFGFSSPAYFSRYVQHNLGVKPTDYRG
ncbi:MAG: helix-turn-helix domain-containing protein [Bacteroides sp.]|nr:helix-turn-helix domain-containing protein [Bacteroides sp.]